MAQKVNFKGREVPWKLGIRSLRRAKRLHGVAVSMEEMQSIGDDGMDMLAMFEMMSKFFWIGLLYGDQNLTREEVDEWLETCDDEGSAYETVMSGMSVIMPGSGRSADPLEAGSSSQMGALLTDLAIPADDPKTD